MAAPSTPAGLALTVLASNLILVSWDDVADEVGFFLYRSLDDITYQKLGATLGIGDLTYYDFSVAPGTLYYYKVSAYNGDGESALSAAVSDTTLAESLKYVRLHNLGPFYYDENAYYKDAGSNRFGFKTSGSIYVGVYSKAQGFVTDHLGALFFCTAIDPTAPTEGDWKICRDGNNLITQRYESSTWVTKQTITP